ncbi:MAG: hypothetical protein ACJ8F7_00495 [Gemmataceae bacterium]
MQFRRAHEAAAAEIPGIHLGPRLQHALRAADPGLGGVVFILVGLPLAGLAAFSAF